MRPLCLLTVAFSAASASIPSVRIRIRSPSGSVSLPAASTAICRPGRTLTWSSTGVGFWLVSLRGALAVHHFVAERVGSRAVSGGDKVDEVAARRRGADAGSAVDAGQLDGVAV